MTKKICLVLILLALIAGVVFSQSEFAEMGKNTITLDFFPTLEGAFIGSIGKALGGGDSGLTSWGFGIGAQYERQLLKILSVAGRFVYLGGGLGLSMSDSGAEAKFGIDINSFSFEGHARFYPFGKAFFLDGLLGYANMTVSLKGQVIDHDTKTSVAANVDASQGFFTLGAKLGWRIKFGSRKLGVIFEPSLGYVYGIANDTAWNKLKHKIEADIEDDSLDQVFNILQNFIFIGGPRIGLSLGFRF